MSSNISDEFLIRQKKKKRRIFMPIVININYLLQLIDYLTHLIILFFYHVWQIGT